MNRVQRRSAVTAFAPEAASAGAARRFVRSTLIDAGIESDLRERAELIVSELVTNAILHTATGPVVSLDIEPKRVRIQVEDSSPTAPILRDYGINASTGRGLHMVTTAATDWGVETTPVGKAIWATVAEATTTSSIVSTAPTPHSIDPSAVDGTVGTSMAGDPFAGLLREGTHRAEFIDIPVDLYEDLERHNEALVREFSLLATNDSDVSNRLLRDAIDLSSTFDVRFMVLRAGLQRAQQNGTTTFSTSVEITPSVAEQVERFRQFVHLTDTLSARGELLTPSAPAPQRALRDWIVDEALQQFTTQRAPHAWRNTPPKNSKNSDS